MLREFELHAGDNSLPTPGISDSNCFTNLYPRRVKAYAGDVFSYLFHKGEVYPCTSCKKDVIYRDIVKCNTCQGNCHKECTSSSVVSKGSSATSSLICKLCLQKRNLMLTSYNTNVLSVTCTYTGSAHRGIKVKNLLTAAIGAVVVAGSGDD
ncbi:DDT domain-containing protein PTM [Zea mays]|uniref:DDT domain-containing protein PTM n=1 Tax=Zea mays TaxID=4577 RepID=A0A1D6IT60_MAIZE|nr:DDT domain-containing protein PTM [Zea mays]